VFPGGANVSDGQAAHMSASFFINVSLSVYVCFTCKYWLKMVDLIICGGQILFCVSRPSIIFCDEFIAHDL
jgi:hypothetical protein